MEALTEKLEQLEGMVKELLEELKSIKEEKGALEVKLSLKDQEFAALKSEFSQLKSAKGETSERLEYVRRLESERDEIRARISEMLAELEKIKEA